MNLCPRRCVECRPGEEKSADFNPDRERAAHFIRQIVRGFDLHPYDINDGQCDEFADALVERLGEGEIVDLGIFFGHFAVLYRGWYFDAEEPYGVRDYRDLPLCLRQAREREIQKVGTDPHAPNCDVNGWLPCSCGVGDGEDE